MPTFVHGKVALFKLGTQGAPGTPTDISNVVEEVTLPRDVDMAETTAFGDTVKKYLPGLPDSQISISGHFDTAAVDAHLSALVGFATAVNWEYGPAGNTATYPKYTGTCYLSGYEITSPVGDKVGFTASFQQAGSITRGTY